MGRHGAHRGIGQLTWLLGLHGLLVVVGALTFVAILWLASDGQFVAADRLGRLFGGVVGVVGGIAIAAANLKPSPHRPFRVSVGAGIALANSPSLWNSVLSVFSPGSTLNASVFTVLTLLGVVSVLIGTVSRVGVSQALWSVRAGVEAAALGLVFSAVAWLCIFRDVVAEARLDFVVQMLPVDGFIFGITILAWAGFRDRGVALTSTGASALIIGDLSDLYGRSSGAFDFPVYGLVSIVAWPMILFGVARAKGRPSGDTTMADAIGERRSLGVVGSVAAMGFAITLWKLQSDGGDNPTWWYLGGGIVLLWGREMIRAVQSGRLLTRLSFESRRDPLTGLPNLRQLDRDLLQLTSTRGLVSVLTVDLQRFKQVNDLIGRPAGDELLRAVGAQLRGLSEDHGGNCYRIAADEFALVVSDCRGGKVRSLAQQVLQSVLTAVEQVPGVSRVPVSAVCGVAELEVTRATTEDDLRSLVNRSAIALRAAKLQRSQVSFYSETLAEQQQREWAIEGRLRERLTRGDAVQVSYQPIHSLCDGQITGVEALARLDDPQLGSVSPSEFIPLAEDHGLIHDLGVQILRKALLDTERMGLFASGKELSVNVSALQLRDGDFVERVRQAIEATTMSPSQLIIEVTESVFVHERDTALATLNGLRELGVKLVLDDFGTGYSSLSYLSRLPVAGLKIDRSLTIDLGEPKTRALAASIASMANTLGLHVVVEGVETQAQEAQVRELGIDLVQGWRFGRPMELGKLEALLGEENLLTKRD